MEEYLCWHLPIFPGSHPPSIVGTIELNFRVRYGNGWTLNVIDTNYINGFDRFYLFVSSFMVTRAGIEPALPA